MWITLSKLNNAWETGEMMIFLQLKGNVHEHQVSKKHTQLRRSMAGTMSGFAELTKFVFFLIYVSFVPLPSLEDFWRQDYI